MEETFAKCPLCGTRFKVQEWKKGIERNVNMVCRIKLKTLPSRYAKVLTMKLGLEDGVAHTFGEVAEEFGVTRERIRQIVEKALAIIRSY
jgi:RNA polymerase primary sigma factor